MNLYRLWRFELRWRWTPILRSIELGAQGARTIPTFIKNSGKWPWNEQAEIYQIMSEKHKKVSSSELSLLRKLNAWGASPPTEQLQNDNTPTSPHKTIHMHTYQSQCCLFGDYAAPVGFFYLKNSTAAVVFNCGFKQRKLGSWSPPHLRTNSIVTR